MAFGNSFGGGVGGGGIPAADSITSAMLAPALRQSLFSRNLLKNPNFAIIQGTASGALANSTALPTALLGYLGETEWIVAAAGGTPAYAFSGASESVTFTGAAGTTNIYLSQRLESRDVVRLANKLTALTLSAEISNSLLTSVTWEVFRPTTSDDVHGTIAAPTQTLIASGTFTVNSTLTRYSASFTLPALATRGLEIRLRVGAQISGTWVVVRLQLEEGSAATNFNCDRFGDAFRDCQRYYQLADCSLQSAVAGFSFVTVMFPTPMFAAPIRTNVAAGTAVNASVAVEAQTANSYDFQITAATVNGYVINRTNSYAAHIP